MKYDLKKPCAQCPYKRDSAPGWTGDYAPEDLVTVVQQEQDFPCHTLINYNDPDWRDNLEEAQQCAGWAVFAANMAKSPRDPEKREFVKRAGRSAECFSFPPELIEYHSGKT